MAARSKWFSTLFLTDLWERFGFYGLLAILVLYAAAPVSEGGLGLPRAEAAALLGVYLAVTFMLSMAGGWAGDRLFGPRLATLWGGITVTLGYTLMALPTTVTTFPGLLGVSIGTALIKPNMTTMLNLHYGTDRAGREAGISMFYVGIQVSALISPLVVGFLGERVDWHLGFAAAACAMAFGVLQYWAGSRHFAPGIGRVVRPATPRQRRVAATAAVLGLVLVVSAGIALTAQHAIVLVGLISLIVPFTAFTFVRRAQAETDRRRITVFLWLLLGASVFWMIAGQDGSLLNLFALHSTERDLFGFAVPASWLQSATPLFILAIAPIFALRWRRYGERLGVPAKFAAGLLLVGASFLVMAGAAALAADGAKVSPLWLLTVYFMHACAELIIAAVGISAAAEVAPPAYQAQIIGLWWLFCALGAGLASQAVRLTTVLPDQVYYLALGTLALAFAFAFIATRHRITRGLTPAPDPQGHEATQAVRQLSHPGA
ncbi:peptide MFS transporter [Rhizohabitans arisaemae]|uniref:peptide MFS transporter n=1 Tax=Rhizohabitans arisaemae TaxID=2720610 RepID=UPI0024B089FC|nr:peptide MFS transporter [Rhizohabitans arisaemae]